MDRLPEVQAAVGTALVTLGDGNWKMGDGLKVTGGKSGEGDEQVLLQHYICRWQPDLAPHHLSNNNQSTS